jgi:exopolysaccharide biosynthesis protein
LYKVTKRRGKLFYIIHLIICEVMFISFFTVVFVYHGPFTKLRDFVVSTSMGTNDYHFISTWFLSNAEIDKILLRTNSVVKDATETAGNVVVAKKHPALAAVNDADPDIAIEDISGLNFKGKLLSINDPSRVTVGIAPALGHSGTTLSKIIKAYDMVGGINAGGFMDAIGAVPQGIVIENGKIKFCQSGMRTYSIIGFDNENILIISNKMSLSQINRSNLRCAVSFGPALIINGQPLVTKGGTTLQPRSAIGQKKDGTVLLLVIDGRQSSSKGVNLKVLQDVLLKHGAYNAANLDGGGSTTLAFNGKIINSPSDITGERAIPSAFLIIPPGKQ